MELSTVSVALVTLLVALLLWRWWRGHTHPPTLPPSPSWALPLLGHLHLLGMDPRPSFHKWRQTCGDVYTIYMGTRLVVVLTGYHVLKEAFVKSADVFSHRPSMFITDKISKNRGIIASSGSKWKEQRKTSLEILRELGLGRNVLAEKIQEEVNHFLTALGDTQGQPSDLHRLVTVSVSNNICSIVFGKRFHYDDPVFCGYLDRVEQNLSNLAGAALINFLPFLEHLPGDMFGIHQILSNVKAVEDNFLWPAIDSHVANMAAQEAEAADFIYSYLQQMKRRQEQGVLTTLCESELMPTVGDLFIAGSETTSTTILWTLLLFLHHPHVQEKCHQEVCDIIGNNRSPSMQDRPRMVYLEAVISEVLRHCSIAPFAVQHCTAEDVTLCGYVIPKDTMVMPFLDTVLHDEDIWGDPHKFRPERFISAEGKLVRPEEFVPFGLGRRACLGENLARMELFLYLANLVQRFHFLPEDQEELPTLKGNLWATHCPKHYKIRAVPRQ